jgi:hypothetical protein
MMSQSINGPDMMGANETQNTAMLKEAVYGRW